MKLILKLYIYIYMEGIFEIILNSEETKVWIDLEDKEKILAK
jgi:hypothetical protein